MEFNSESAMREYIENPSMTYRKIAEKYCVSLSAVQRAAKSSEWVKQRNEKYVGNCKDKLMLLKNASDRAIEALYNSLADYELLSINDLKNISSILKTLTGVQRDLNDLPNYKEENTIRISNERLQIVRAKISSSGSDDENETGVVLIPFLDEENEEDNVVFEREEDV